MTDHQQRCNQCILPVEYPGVSFDESGRCNYCKKWELKWAQVDYAKQNTLLEGILNKHRGRSQPYDCLVGLSGGKDSCYAAYVMKKRDMSPLGCTFDNGFMTEKALANIESTVKSLSIGHVFVRPSSGYLHDLYRQFLLTTGEFCSVCNVGIRSSLYRIARSYGINLIVSGQSTRTEANSPRAFFCCTPGYFQNVASPMLSRREIRGYVYVSQLGRAIRHLRKSPFYLQLPSYLPWKEEQFIKILEDELNWKGSYGEQHTDCRMSDAKEYLKLKHFDVTEMTSKLSSLIRDKQLSRDQALARCQQHMLQLRGNEAAIREQIKTELNLSDEQLDEAIQLSHVPYLSKMDGTLSAAKNLYERLRFRK